jgi:hypothetical protein
MTGGDVKQSYLANVETGRARVIYPEYANPLTKVLDIPGWTLLKEMGYRTDAAGSRPVPWEVVELYEGLTDEGRRLAKQMLRALPQAS